MVPLESSGVFWFFCCCFCCVRRARASRDVLRAGAAAALRWALGSVLTMGEPSWVRHAIFWHVYPLGFAGADTTGADRTPTSGLRALADRLEREAPLIRLETWQIGALDDGSVRLTGTMVATWR